MSSSAVEISYRQQEAWLNLALYHARLSRLARRALPERLMRRYGWIPPLPPRSGDMAQMVDDIAQAQEEFQ